MYGAAFFRDAPYAQFMFQERFRVEGGKFFDEETMKATVNSDVGVKVFTDMRAENALHAAGRRDLGLRREPRGVPGRRYRDDHLLAALWPLGRGLRHRRGGALVGAEVADRRQGRLRAAAGRPSAARRRLLARGLGLVQQNKEAAYLFIQWLNSKDISLERVQLPYALRDPFRASHFASEEYKSRWPEAPEYLAALQAGAVSGLLDLSLIQTDKYEEALRQGISRLWAGEDPKTILDDVAAQWDAVTEQIGVDAQREAYRRLGRQAQRLSELRPPAGPRTPADWPCPPKGVPWGGEPRPVHRLSLESSPSDR